VDITIVRNTIKSYYGTKISSKRSRKKYLEHSIILPVYYWALQSAKYEQMSAENYNHAAEEVRRKFE